MGIGAGAPVSDFWLSLWTVPASPPVPFVDRRDQTSYHVWTVACSKWPFVDLLDRVMKPFVDVCVKGG